jgi:exo-poly-alpha-galacturonosidase
MKQIQLQKPNHPATKSLIRGISIMSLTFMMGQAYALQASLGTAPLNVHVPAETVTSDSALLLWDKPDSYDASTFKHFKVFCNGKLLGTTKQMGYQVNGIQPSRLVKFAITMVANSGKDGELSVPVKLKTKAASPVINIKDHGAVGDGSTLCTDAIRAAIAACPKGGTVLIPDGVFISGPLSLKSDMTLRVDGTLKGSSKVEDYFPLVRCRFEGFELDCYPSLVNLGRLDHKGPAVISNVVICGKGTIDASGYQLGDRENNKSGNRSRGRAVCMMNAENVCLKDLTVTNAPAWNIHPIYSKNVSFSGLRVISRESKDRRIRNGDGIDPDSSTNINIFNCYFHTGDDSIAIKSGKNLEGFTVGRATENVRVTDCVVEDSMGGIVIGSEMSGSVRHVQVENCKISGLDWEGIDIKTSLGRGGVVEDVSFRDIDIDRAVAGIRVTTSYSVNNDGDPAPSPPKITNISYRNIDCKNVGTGMQCIGAPESIITNITVTDSKIVGINGGAHIRYTDNIKFIRTNPEKWEVANVTNIDKGLAK